MTRFFAANACAFVLLAVSSMPAFARPPIGTAASAPGFSAPSAAAAAPVPNGVPVAFPNEGWAARTAMSGGRWAHGMASYSTGSFPANASYVYVMGGADATFANTPLVWRYDVNADTWSDLAPLPQTRTQVGAVRVGEKIYVPGGYGGSFSPVTTLSIYDIPSDTWTTGAPLLQATGDYAIGTYADRYVYVIGGYSGSVDLNTVQVYDTVANTWQAATSKSGLAMAGLRGGIVDNRIVVVGGYSQVMAATQAEVSLGVIDPADPTQIAWTVSTPYPGGPSGRLGAGVPVAGGPAEGTAALNVVLFTSGDPNGAGTVTKNDTWLYDFNDDTWKSGPTKPTGVSNIVNLAGVASGGKLHMVSVGGYNGTSVVSVNEWLTFGDEVTPDLSLTVAADAAVLVPGATLIHTLDHAVVGTGSAPGVTVTGTVPAGTAFVAAESSPGWICTPDAGAGSTCVAALGTLAAGSTGALDFAVQSIYPVPAGVSQIEFDAAIATTGIEVDASNNSGSAATPFAAGIVAVAPLAGLSTDESGAQAHFDVKLDVPPTADVTIDLVSSDPDEGTLSPASLLFTPANWNQVQTVTVSGVDDGLEDGDSAYTVDGSIAAGAGNYDGVPVASVALVNIDSLPIPPAVGSIDSVRGTGDGVLLAGEATAVPITQLLVGFSEALDNSAHAADDPANYRLVTSGADGVLQSVDCAAAPAGDDVEIGLASVTYADAPSGTTVQVGDARALPRGLYRLLVCDDLADLIGAALDGDGNGVAGGDFVHDFSVTATNRIRTPNFDVDLGLWIPDSAEAQWAPHDADGVATSGALQVASLDGAGMVYRVEQCLPERVLGAASALTHVDAATAIAPQVDLGLEFFAGSDCSGAALVSAWSDPQPGDTAGGWRPLAVAAPADLAAGGSTRVVLRVTGGEAEAFTVAFDHIESADPAPVFADGFEEAAE